MIGDTTWNDVIRHAAVTGATRCVALVLAARANKDRQTWPTMETIASEAGCSKRYARRAIREMEDLGMVSVNHNTGRPSSTFTFSERTSWAGERGTMLPPLVPDKEEPQVPPKEEPCFLSENPMQVPKRGTTGPKKRNHRSQKEEPQVPQKYRSTEVQLKPLQESTLPILVDSTTSAIPTKTVTGETLSKTIASWAVQHGRQAPPKNDRAMVYRWLVDVIRVELSPERHNGVLAKVMGDYITEMYDRGPNSSEFQMLGMYLKTFDAGDVFEAIVEAVERGIGIDPDSDRGDKGLMLYVRAVLRERLKDSA